MPEDIIRARTVNQLVEEWRTTSRVSGHRKSPLTVVGVGAHPDDPETGCGGTLAQFTAEGHNVHILYLTRGEAGRKGEAAESTAVIRTSEALNACAVLQATPHFAGQIDGKTVADPEHVQKFAQMLLAINPDIVFTHWPMDTHADHRNVAMLTQHAWEASDRNFMLVHYEVMTNIQTQEFKPNLFIDIGPALTTKHDAIFSHECQNPTRFYTYHVGMEGQRGRQSLCSRAEAFHVVPQDAPKPFRPLEMAPPAAVRADQLNA